MPACLHVFSLTHTGLCVAMHGLWPYTSKSMSTLLAHHSASPSPVLSAESSRVYCWQLQGRLMELMSGGPSAAQPPASYRHLLGAASADAFIVSIESVSLTQTAGSSQDHRCATQRVHVMHTHNLHEPPNMLHAIFSVQRIWQAGSYPIRPTKAPCLA